MKQSVMRMSYEKSARGMRYEQIAAAKETLEKFWARKGAPSRKFPRERRRPTFAEAPTEGVYNKFYNIKIFDA